MDRLSDTSLLRRRWISFVLASGSGPDAHLALRRLTRGIIETFRKLGVPDMGKYEGKQAIRDEIVQNCDPR